jgi:DNA repair exonuclease SbcCD ATPase subunit
VAAVEFEKYRKMHDDLKKEYDSIVNERSHTQSSIQFSPHADIRASQLAQDNEDKSLRLEGLEEELERRQGELLKLADLRKLLEVTNSDLIRRLELEQSKVDGLKMMVEEYEEESQTREATLAKAQSLIKKLNDECETTVRDLKRAEDAVELLKKDNRLLDRSNNDLQRQIQEVSLMKKTEERLRGEIVQLKQELHDLAAAKDEAVGELSHAVVQLEDENQQLEGGIQELELKLEEIERQSSARDQAIAEQHAELTELRAEVQRKDELTRRMAEDLEKREAEREDEVFSIKRHAENVIRQLQTSQGGAEEDQSFTAYNKLNRSRGEQGGQGEVVFRGREEGGRSREEGGRGRVSSMKRSSPSRTKSKQQRSEDKENLIGGLVVRQGGVEVERLVVSPIAMQNLAVQLEEALVRERDLKQQLYSIVEHEAVFLRDKLKQLSLAEVAIKPELERWIMRNEELEQHLVDLTDKNSRLLRLLTDCKKTILIKNKQMSDSKKTAENLREALAEALEIRGIALLDGQNLLQKEVLPKAEAVAAEQTSTAQAQAILFREEIEEHRGRLREAEEFLEQERQRVRELLNEVADLRGVCTTGKLDREAIERQLRQPKGQGSLEGVSREAKAIISWVVELQNLEEALKHEQDHRTELMHSHSQLKLTYQDLERSSAQSLQELRSLIEAKQADWTSERQSLQGQIEDIRGAAYNDRQNKEKELDAVEQAIDLVNERCLGVQEQLASAEADNAALRQRLDKTIEESAKDRESYSQEIQDLALKLDTAGLELDKAIQSLRRTERELVLVKDELSLSKTKHREELSRTVDEAAERLRVKDRVLQQLKDDNENYLKEKTRLEEQLTLYGGEAAELKMLGRSTSAEHNAQTIKRELDRTRSELDRAHSELAMARREPREFNTPEVRRERHKGDSEKTYGEKSQAVLESESVVRHLEKVVDHKNTVIANLEQQLRPLLYASSTPLPPPQASQPQSSRLELTKSMRPASGSLRHFMGEEGRLDDSNSDFSRTIEHLESTVDKLKRKKETDKRSFQKRVKEFELILRYLEEKINEATEFKVRAVISDEKMVSLVGDLAQRNPTLNTWLRVLSNKLDTFCQSAQMQLFREKLFYSEVVTLLLDNSPLFVDLGELAGLYNELTGTKTRVDLDQGSKRVLDHLTRYFRERESGTHRRMMSGSSQHA